MNFFYFKVLWSRPKIKIFIISTAIGGLLQIISCRYLRNHPEFLEKNKEEPPSKKSNIEPQLLPTGGAFIEFTTSGLIINISQIAIKQAILNFLARNGLIADVRVGHGIALSKIPAIAISTFLSDAFLQKLAHLEKKKFILINGEKIYFDPSNQNLNYLF